MSVSFLSIADAHSFVETAIQDNRKSIDYDATMAAINTLGEVDDFRRFEAPVLLGCFLQKGPKETYALLSKYQAFCESAGKPEQFTAFKARCDALVAPRMITFHGYRVPIGTGNTQILAKGIMRVVDMMKELGYDIFINSGTLLGMVRDGTFIPFDDDVDFGVILHSPTPEEAAHEWIALKDKLAEMGVLTHIGWLGGILNVKHIGPFSVDLFPAWIHNDKVFVYPHTFGNLTRDDLLPLRATEPLGLPMPQNPEKMMVSNYGEDWRVPNPAFQFHWGRNKYKFNDFVDISEAMQPK